MRTSRCPRRSPRPAEALIDRVEPNCAIERCRRGLARGGGEARPLLAEDQARRAAAASWSPGARCPAGCRCQQPERGSSWCIRRQVGRRRGAGRADSGPSPSRRAGPPPVADDVDSRRGTVGLPPIRPMSKSCCHSRSRRGSRADGVEVGHDRLERPVPIAVHDDAAVTVVEQLGVVLLSLLPRTFDGPTPTSVGLCGICSYGRPLVVGRCPSRSETLMGSGGRAANWSAPGSMSRSGCGGRLATFVGRVKYAEKGPQAEKVGVGYLNATGEVVSAWTTISISRVDDQVAQPVVLGALPRDSGWCWTRAPLRCRACQAARPCRARPARRRPRSLPPPPGQQPR